MYPRIEVRLTSGQRQRLQQIRDQPPTPRVGKRAVCLLLSAEGVSNQLLAQATGLGPDSLRGIRRRWNEHGMASLKDAPRPGRPPKIGPAYRQECKEALRRGPLLCGYAFTTWSIARLNTHLHRVTGVNRKQTVFGAFCYGRGLFFYHVQPRKTAWGVQLLLQKLVHRARRTGRRIIAVMDQGSPHHAEALPRYLEDVKEHLEVFWLPYHSPELNLSERLWKHLKASRMANVLSPSSQAFTTHIHSVLRHFVLHPDLVLSVAASTHQTITRKNILAAT